MTPTRLFTARMSTKWTSSEGLTACVTPRNWQQICIFQGMFRGPFSVLSSLFFIMAFTGCFQSEYRTRTGTPGNPTIQNQDTDKNSGVSTPGSPRPGNQLTGPGEGGGGDPDAQSFIQLSYKLSRFYTENPTVLDLPFDAEAFQAEVEKLDASLKDPDAIDLVEFTEQVLKDSAGVTKVALFDKTSGKIQVYRPYWSEASDEDKFVLITMEIAGLLDVDVRYETARAFVKDRAPMIFAMPVHGSGEQTPIGWWMAGQDPNLFSRISEHDVVIDGGIVGTGSENNQRVIEFMENPLADEDWVQKARPAFEQKLPAYFLLRDESGQRASLTAFRETDTGVAIYSLYFVASSIPVGTCRHTATELSALERLNSCLFDKRFYRLYDSTSSAAIPEGGSHEDAWNKAFGKLHDTLKRHYSSSSEYQDDALDESLIQDLSNLFPPQFRSIVRIRSLEAHHLVPTLGKGPVAFWKVEENENSEAIRFYQALKTLSNNNLGFYAGQHPRCVYMKDDQEELASDFDPRILDRNELRVLFDEDHCLLRSHDNILAGFYGAMAKKGYVYQPDQQLWTLGEPRIVHNTLLMGNFLAAHKIVLRQTTENLNGDQVFELIQKTLNDGDLMDRLGIYKELLRYWRHLNLNPQQATSLYERALADVITLENETGPNPEEKHIVFTYSTLYPLPDFLIHSLNLAVSNRLISAELSEKFLSQVVASKVFGPEMARTVMDAHFSGANRSGRDFPYLNQLLQTIVTKDFFDSELAGSMISRFTQSVYYDFNQDPSHSNSYLVRKNLIQTIQASGKLDATELEKFRARIARVEMGAALEVQAKESGLDINATADLLRQWLADDSSKAWLGTDIAANLLATTAIQEATRISLVRQLIASVAQLDPSKLQLTEESKREGAVAAMINIFFNVDLPQAVQEEIFELIVVTLKDRGEVVEWARLSLRFDFFNHKRWRAPHLRGAQKGFELMAEHSTEVHDTQGPLAERSDIDFTENNAIVDGLKMCREHPTHWPSCEFITDAKTILEKIVANEHTTETTRTAATEELSHY